MKLVILLAFFISECISLNDSILNETFLMTIAPGRIFRNYLIQNDTEMLYTELLLRYNQWDNLTSHYSINTYWFFKEYKFYFSKIGYFFALGQTKKLNNGTFNDFKICRYIFPIVKCEDFHYFGSSDNIIDDIKENFVPILDSSINGTDDIYSYTFGEIVENGIESYNSLINCKITLPMFKEDNFDMELNSDNNLTFVVGSLNSDKSYRGFEDYQVLKVESMEVKEMLKISGSILRLYFLIFIMFFIII